MPTDIPDARRPDDDYPDDYDDRPRRRRRPPPRRGSNTVWVVLGVVLLLGVCGVAMLFLGVSKVRQAAALTQASNNLKQIGLGYHMYAGVNGSLPRDIAGPDGTPLLSWRVAVLPYLEQGALHRRFRLDEPWDGPNNRSLLQAMPRVYANPRFPPPGPGLTHFQSFVGPRTPFDPGTKPLAFAGHHRRHLEHPGRRRGGRPGRVDAARRHPLHAGRAAAGARDRPRHQRPARRWLGAFPSRLGHARPTPRLHYVQRCPRDRPVTQPPHPEEPPCPPTCPTTAGPTRTTAANARAAAPTKTTATTARAAGGRLPPRRAATSSGSSWGWC